VLIEQVLGPSPKNNEEIQVQVHSRLPFILALFLSTFSVERHKKPSHRPGFDHPKWAWSTADANRAAKAGSGGIASHHIRVSSLDLFNLNKSFIHFYLFYKHYYYLIHILPLQNKSQVGAGDRQWPNPLSCARSHPLVERFCPAACPSQLPHSQSIQLNPALIPLHFRDLQTSELRSLGFSAIPSFKIPHIVEVPSAH
jgi:hypothetical protein